MTAHTLPSPIVPYSELDPEFFPELGSSSPAHLYRFIPVPNNPAPPEVVYVSPPRPRESHAAFVGTLASWNLLWETGGLQQDLLKDDFPDWPASLKWLFERKYRGKNIRLVSLTKLRWGAYDPIYRLLPRDILRRHELPALRRGLWPHHPWNETPIEQALPVDFKERISQAFASHIWKLINPRAPKRSFSKEEPIHLLAHNLDFWIPYVELMAQERARALGRANYDEEETSQKRLHQKLLKRYKDAPFKPERPLHGGSLWMGESEAWEATQRVIELADQRGNLRAILDAFRSHRVEEDFSSLWSYEREDFERKLYAKRNKVRISFVELHDTLPVHAPEAECHENILWADLMALLDTKERAIVVCLRNGRTQLDIASRLGYANHSAVSKTLSRIRRKARSLLGSKTP